MIRRPPRSTLFPCTALVRSSAVEERSARGGVADAGRQGDAGGLEQSAGSPGRRRAQGDALTADRKSTRLNSSHANISYAVFCLKKIISSTSSLPITPIGLIC